MNIVIYTLVFFGIIYFLLKLVANASSKKISKHLRKLIFLGLIILAIFLLAAGKFLLSIPLTLLSLALVKLKGFSVFQLIGLFRLIQTLRRSGRFSFNQSQNIKNSATLSLDEAYNILNLDIKKKYTKLEVLNIYKKIMKKIHPDINPELSRLASIVNQAKDMIINNL
ncbi:molecular chaperone DnaJ [Candidatus Pelagibacter sp.]|nr:molecular chaperone DnaJ [Candidatus Pelagibacter sp.]